MAARETGPLSTSAQCEACKADMRTRKIHWWYSFGSVEALFRHLEREGIQKTEAQRRAIAAWWGRVEDDRDEVEKDLERQRKERLYLRGKGG